MMGVDADYQRRGIGRQLLDAIRYDVSDRGLTANTLTVYAANSMAREFYADYGFVPFREDWRLS